LNIGPDGVRRTCFNSDDPRAKRVWVFGGSTVWGTGSPDCETLPSHLSQLLNMSGPHIVTNYGEGGYVSTQALIRFLTLLRNGDRPDVAIFYGGFNDVWTAIYARAGTHQDEPRMRAALEASHWQRAVAGFRTVIDRDYLTLYYSLRLFGVRAGEPQDSWIPATEADSAGEVVKAVDLYLENTRITEALANSYGIEVHSYWQPNVADKTPLSDVEAAQVKTLAPVLVSAFQSAGRIIDERGVSYGVVNLQRALRDAPRTLFTDYAHISGSGNRVIASRIARDIQALPAGQR
jgi:lysophospholipase L1-like esterase